MSKLQKAAASGFATDGIWDDSIPWFLMKDKYFIDDKNRIRQVKKINYHRGTVTLYGGGEVRGDVIDGYWKSMHNTSREAVEALRHMQ